MKILSGYGSSDEDEEEVGNTEKGSRGVVKSQPTVTADSRRKVRLHYSKLPISRPLLAPGTSAAIPKQQEPEADAGELEKAEARAAQASSQRRDSGSEGSDSDEVRSCGTPDLQVSWLPAPKNLPASEPGALGSEVDIDFASAGKPKEKPQAAADATAWLIKAASAPDVEEGEEKLPASFLKHPMLRTLHGTPDGPTPEELEHLQSKAAMVTHIHAAEMKDPDWQMNSLFAGQPGFHRGGKVPAEVSQYDAETFNSSTLANPSRTQKRKHHINWLASEAIEKEAEHLDRAAGGRLTKAQTMGRYGW
eukprot:TRINITY_DN19632_c0_g1_i1.p1 TRINITY_DN19632_c0_g1~~TRINITY_DN19632_c0_g1_i1.p1  ORF type:complete len:306 (+),score=88.66 TRINITY_DN19632_c0_g1_i1:121-1038(+)